MPKLWQSSMGPCACTESGAFIRYFPPLPGQDIKTTSDHASRTYTASSEDFDSNA